MKTQLKAKLLQHLLRNKKNDKGFTLIELLVVIIIIGILAAIALPSFLNQASKARQSEAKQTLGALVRGQQAYRLENPRFASEISLLALGVKSETQNYQYGSVLSAKDAEMLSTNFGKFDSTDADIDKLARIYADALDDDAVKDYAGAAAASEDESGNATTITQLCESNKPLAQNGGQAVALKYNAGSTGTPSTLTCTDPSTDL